MESKFILGDCMNEENGLPSYPDDYFDLAIVDPPYGILSSAGDRLDKYGQQHKDWDSSVPSDDYFTQLVRVSKNQIIWGGNYFSAIWKDPCKCFIFWYKHQPIDNWAKGELAWTSFNKPAKCYDLRYYGNIGQEPERFHPTQKPTRLYERCLEDFAQPGDVILDTHVGSASSLIACINKGFSYVGYEIDPDYYDKATRRMAKGVQRTIF